MAEPRTRFSSSRFWQQVKDAEATVFNSIGAVSYFIWNIPASDLDRAHKVHTCFAAPAPKDIRPEWYFVFMFETLKFVPGGSVLGLEYEAIPILGFGAAALLLTLVPFLDRGVARRGRSPGFTAVGVVALVYLVAVTCWGYRSLVPLYAVLGGAALVWIFALVIEGGERRDHG